MYQNVRNIPEIEEAPLTLEVRSSRLHHLKHVSRTLWEESRASGDRQSESSGYFLLKKPGAATPGCNDMEGIVTGDAP